MTPGVYNIIKIHKIDQPIAKTYYIDFIVYNKQFKRENVIDHILYDKNIDSRLFENTNSDIDTIESKVLSKEFKLKPLNKPLEIELYDYFNNYISNNIQDITINTMYKSKSDIANDIIRTIMRNSMVIQKESYGSGNNIKVICGIEIFDNLMDSQQAIFNSVTNSIKLYNIDIYVDYKIDPYVVIMSAVDDGRQNGGFMLFQNDNDNTFCIDSTDNIGKLTKVLKFEYGI